MNHKRTKGFTLIELLAVIVILAIIALIAVPVIMNIINQANKSAFKDTAYGIINAGELYFAEQQLEPQGMLQDVTITLPDTTKKLELKGEVPIGSITITQEGKISLVIKNNRYCITKGIDDKDITVTEDVENCEIPSGGNTAGNENEGTGGSGNQGGSVTLPESGVDATTREITDSWEQIQQAISEGVYATCYKTGDTKTITLTTGQEVVMEIVAFDVDEKTDGSTAAITWLSKDLLATKHAMNSTQTNAGGWEASEMRSWLQTDVYNTLPSEVKNAIVEVNKTYGDYNGGSYTTKTCADKVWIPSYREMFGDDRLETSGATYTSYFTTAASRVKNYSGAAANWWSRSAASHSSRLFRSVTYDGKGDNPSAPASLGVALGFCM